MRNSMQSGSLQLVGNFRTTVMVFARAEQAEHVRGWDPLRCLIAEYITRDWSGLPSACSTTHLFHVRWPGGILTGEESNIAQESVEKIFRFPVGFAWFSLFEAIELHLPFVDSWGPTYNRLASLGMFLLYLGILCTGRALTTARTQYFLVVIFYTTLIFSLTDATPRYLMPSIFAYATMAGIGYDKLLQSLSRLHTHVFYRRHSGPE